MDPKKSSSASPFPARKASTYPPPFDASPSTSQEYLSALGFPCGKDHTKAVEVVLSRHPQIMQCLLHYKTGSLIGDSSARILEQLNYSVKFSCQALAQSPNSISFALFHAILLFELARNDAGSYNAVVRECERALLIENPTEPGCKVPFSASRQQKMRKKLVELIKKSKRQIIVLGGGNRRDKWKRLLVDNSLAEVKAEFEALLGRKKEIAVPRPSDFTSIKKHKKVKSNVATFTRVRAFWNDSMSVEKKREFLRIGIKDLKAYLDKNDLRMAKEVLTEAIDYSKAKKLWRFWACYCCGERVLDSDFSDHIWNHLGTLSNSSLWLMPDEAPEIAVDDIYENFVWNPVKLIYVAEIMESWSDPSDWPSVEDSERTKIIERIREKLQLFRSNKCLARSHLYELQYLITKLLKNHTIHKSLIDGLWLRHTLNLIRFLEVPELKIVLEFLEEVASACALHCLGAIFSEDDDQRCWGYSRERIVFNSDFSALLFDDRLLRGEIVEPDSGIAVVTSIAKDCDADCDSDPLRLDDWLLGGDIGSSVKTIIAEDSDALVDWLWTEHPTIEEQIRAWTSVRKANQIQGRELYKILEDESRRLLRMYERKGKYLRYQKPLQNVAILCSYKNRKREQISSQGNYVSLLFKRWKELEIESKYGDETQGAAELDIIWSIMKDSEADFEIQVVIQWQINRLAQELCKLDAIIMTTLASMRQTMLVSMFDYRFVMLPQLKSFMKAQLEDLVNKDNVAAAEALLAEVAPDAKTTNKRGRQGQGQGRGPGKSKKTSI
ncbi:uncharacterized protein LOC132163845 [Corylus avellana]|uniref:uncharacterized protein LOC132163845 n=1 Tax=Corylus avellana TaxID=13451 RepID=UPI00286BE3E9|nr:uncharacterized protein LOC132163845 [Corylus avellana]